MEARVDGPPGAGAPGALLGDRQDVPDNLFEQYSATVDEASRTAIATKMGTIQQDETPVLLAFWMDSLRATSAKVHDVQGLEAYLDLTRTYLS